jgi:transcription-repair coupling factor (superfamily II helicase)
MPDSPSLASTLAERTGLTVDDLARPEPAEALEPLPSLLPPEGVTASRVRDVAARAKDLGHARIDVAGVRGSAGASLAASIARAGRRVVFVTADLDGARRVAEDIGFLVRGALAEDAEDTGEGEVLVFAVDESSPYADVNPDRRAAMSRMATLYHLAHDRPWSVLALPASALARKVPPRRVLARRADRIVAEQELDRDAFVRSLLEAGYLRVPVVEDPGSFAVRGALLDLWSPSSDAPVRVDLYGELVLSIKPFDPLDQTTKKDAPELRQVWLSPVREAILDAPTVARARARVTQLAEMIDWPTTKTRALVEDVTSGRAFFGADGFLPAYYDELDPLFAYVPADAVVVLDDPPAITRAIRDELARGAEDAAQKETKAPAFLPQAFYRDEETVAGDLAERSLVALHRTPVAGAPETGLGAFEGASQPLDLASADHDDLTRAVKAARASRGKNATLAPLVRRIAHWREHGLRVFLTARAQTQAERLVGLLRHQGVPCRARLATFQPAWLDEPVHDVQVVVGPLARGVILPADGVVLVTEEEIFGSRVHRRRERARAAVERPFVEDLRSLAPGDCVVHVEHGIGRYQGLVHKALPGRERTATGALTTGLTVDLIAIEYAGGDKLYLPVWRLNQLEKYVGGEGSAPKLDRLEGARSRAPRPGSRARSARWPTSSCACTPSAEPCPAMRCPRPTTTTARSKRRSLSTRPPTRPAPSTT